MQKGIEEMRIQCSELEKNTDNIKSMAQENSHDIDNLRRHVNFFEEQEQSYQKEVSLAKDELTEAQRQQKILVKESQ